jgi:phytanoyl-CoA hydroxylase
MQAAQPRTHNNDDLKAYYDEHGYVICRGLINDIAVDRVMQAYKADILHSKSKFFRQNENKYNQNRVTSHGFVEQSFLDPHNYKRFPEFRSALMDLYFSSEMRVSLSRLTGANEHNLMQSMFFDANAATPPHQDWWYLDTVPLGNLLGAWIALEDIEEEAGRFFVLPGSQILKLHREGMAHSEWMRLVADYVAAHPQDVYAPDLKKGDVLFWNSRTVHGSHATIDPRYSRKSLTAHFMPADMVFGNLFTSKPWVQYENYGSYRYFANQPEYSRRAEIASKVKVALYDHPRLLKWTRRLQRKSLAEL